MMERLRKIATTLRNNWKKTVVLTAAAGYGFNWNQKRLQNNAMMTACCREALNYGSATQGVSDTNYHVTVILNPAASGGKGRKLFEQYSAPLLHLAGFKVSVQLTEGRNEAKELMKIMDNTDAVLIAGGDGTVMEAVTGMLRREDAEVFRHVPIGIIPVGENNTLSTRLFPGLDHVRKMAESTMSVIKQLKKPINVIEVENLCENEEYKGKKLHALNSLQIGAWREAAQRRDSYWYWGGLKDKLCFVFGYLTAHKNINWDWSVMVESGSTEQIVHQVEEKRRGLSSLFSSTPSIVEVVETAEEWDQVLDKTVSEIDLSAGEEDKLEMKVFPQKPSFSEFYNHGVTMFNGGSSSLQHQEFSAKHFKIDIKSLSEEPARSMSVDGEDVELVGPIRASLLPGAITVFCREDDAVTPVRDTVQEPSRWSNVGVSSLMANSRQRL